MSETFSVTQCIYGFKEQDNLKKKQHEQAFGCWTERMTEHTSALHQSISTMTDILTSTPTASVHEPEKA